MALSESALYYRRNKKARDKKKRYDAELNSSETQTTKRVESNRARRRAKRRGQNVEGKDYDHAVDKFVSVKRNRGRRGEGNR
jgi:23S rRNA-/tRNA-specific pseudouridylate synthase